VRKNDIYWTGDGDDNEDYKVLLYNDDEENMTTTPLFYCTAFLMKMKQLFLFFIGLFF